MSVFKKDYPTNAKNYRPVCVLPKVSKITNAQAKKTSKQVFTLTDFSIERVSVPNTYFCLLLKNVKLLLDGIGYGGTKLMNLSKAFNTINHDLLIAK